MKPTIHHPPPRAICGKRKEGLTWGPGKSFLPLLVPAAFSALAFCVGDGIFQSGWKVIPLISGTVESFSEMRKVPNKAGFLSLAAAAPQNFPGCHASKVTSPLLVCLLAVQISASGFKGETLVPPFATMASFRQDRTICILTPLNVLSQATKSCNPCTKRSVVSARNHP